MRAQRSLFFWALLPCLYACQPSATELVQQAERESLNQRSQLAQHLYLQVVSTHTTKDVTRLKALIGLSDVAFNQLHDYRLAVGTFEKLFAEYGSGGGFEKDVRRLRLQASRAARIQLQDTERSLRILEPLTKTADLSLEEMQELGRAYGFIFNLSESEKYFVMAMDRSLKESNCRVAREVQVDLMQALALNKECKKSIEWGKRDLFEGCKPDYYSVNLELAHCYEAVGSIDQAIHLYESMLNETPENSRIHFLLSSIKKRQKERQLK